MLYLHGGGFHIGGRYLHRQMVGRFAELLSAPLLHVNYRKLPCHSIGAAIDDCLDAYRYLLDSGVDPSRMIVMGDSAGGYLTFTTALSARDARLPMPAALVTMSPFTNWDTTKCAAPSAATCTVFPRQAITGLITLAAKRAAGTDLICPVACRLAGLPPTLIQASSTEMLYPDAVQMANRLVDDGVACELQIWDRQVHVFQAAAAIVPESAQAVAETVRFVDRVVPASTQPSRPAAAAALTGTG